MGIENELRTNEVLEDVAVERLRQLAKWGDQHHDDAWWCVIEAEEFGEVAREVYEKAPASRLREELVQVAAVAVAWIEDIDSRGD